MIRSLEGEFAYTIFDRQSQLIYFGRDSVGKRSLSYSFHEATGQLYIASVTGVTPEDWKYENCVGGVIYKYDIKAKQLDDSHLIQPLFQVTDLVDPTEASLPETIDRLFSHLSIAVEKRIKSIHPKHIKNSPISILFSGGLDCSVLVALICQYLISSNTIAPTIELLNVAFENPRTGLQPSQAPDRLLAQNSYSILKNLFPQINILLLEIDVPYQEYLQERSKVIDLMYPKDTEMDLSIAIAFYFASRGHGNVLLENGDKQPYDRHGIVLFSGLGADELYGGYHKFNNKSQQDLIHELTRQINNIHDRNLNRDDKVIAHNGVEVRYPFLDINVIDFSINQIPINFKINKLILRHLAKQRLNLAEIALEPKRAIQFGSKSAKMTKNGNKKGTDLLK